MKILLAEEDRLLARGLDEEGFEVVSVHSAEEGGVDSRPGDLLILDCMWPGKDGGTCCHELRARCIGTPILMLTARDAVADRIIGLNTGADDYLTKPFVFEELLARVRALWRCTECGYPPLLQATDLRLDPHTHVVRRGSAMLNLTPKEYVLLEFLVRPVSRAQLAEQVWQAGLNGIGNLTDVHMKNLRSKVGAPGLPSLIQTVRSGGLCLTTAGGPDA